MADLLSAAAHASIASALRDVADTFLKHVVTYYRRLPDTMDRWSEDQTDRAVGADVFNLKVLAEPMESERDEADEDRSGRVEKNHVVLTCYVDDLVAAGLVEQTDTEQKFLGSAAQDWFLYNGDKYTVVMQHFDGQLKPGGLHYLCLIRGRKQEHTHAAD